MGRPKKDIDLAMVKQMARVQCSLREIAAEVGCDEKTLRNRFSAEIASARDCGKSRLRRLQFAAANKGSVPMLMFLGKQWLGQAEKVNAAVDVTAVPYDPLKIYAGDPKLLERALKLEEDMTNATSTDAPTLPFDPGANRHSGLGLSTTPPTPPAGGNGTPDKSDG